MLSGSTWRPSRAKAWSPTATSAAARADPAAATASPPAGEALWPKRYGQLTNQLLDFVRQESPELVDKVFTRRGEAGVGRAAKRLSGLGFDARIEELTRILDEDGYLAQCRREADGSWLVVEHNWLPAGRPHALARRSPDPGEAGSPGRP